MPTCLCVQFPLSGTSPVSSFHFWDPLTDSCASFKTGSHVISRKPPWPDLPLSPPLHFIPPAWIWSLASCLPLSEHLLCCIVVGYLLVSPTRLGALWEAGECSSWELRWGYRVRPEFDSLPPSLLCDFGQVPSLFYALVSPSVTVDRNCTILLKVGVMSLRFTHT